MLEMLDFCSVIGNAHRTTGKRVESQIVLQAESRLGPRFLDLSLQRLHLTISRYVSHYLSPTEPYRTTRLATRKSHPGLSLFSRARRSLLSVASC